jgi:hypothetical protein
MEANKLPERQLYNYKIIIKEGNILDLDPYIEYSKINSRYYKSI